MLDPTQLSPEQRRPITRGEFRRICDAGVFEGERVELIRGVVVRRMTRNAPHDTAIERLTELLVPPLVGRARVRVQLAFAADDYSEPEPDIAVVPKIEPYDDHPGRALLLIEVADSSLSFDRGIKAEVYASNGVPEYWVVSIPDRMIEVRSDPQAGQYRAVRTVGLDENLPVPGFPDVVVSVRAVFGTT